MSDNASNRETNQLPTTNYQLPTNQTNRSKQDEQDKRRDRAAVEGFPR